MLLVAFAENESRAEQDDSIYTKPSHQVSRLKWLPAEAWQAQPVPLITLAFAAHQRVFPRPWRSPVCGPKSHWCCELASVVFSGPGSTPTTVITLTTEIYWFSLKINPSLKRSNKSLHASDWIVYYCSPIRKCFLPRGEALPPRDCTTECSYLFFETLLGANGKRCFHGYNSFTNSIQTFIMVTLMKSYRLTIVIF